MGILSMIVLIMFVFFVYMVSTSVPSIHKPVGNLTFEEWNKGQRTGMYWWYGGLTEKRNEYNKIKALEKQLSTQTRENPEASIVKNEQNSFSYKKQFNDGLDMLIYEKVENIEKGLKKWCKIIQQN